MASSPWSWMFEVDMSCAVDTCFSAKPNCVVGEEGGKLKDAKRTALKRSQQLFSLVMTQNIDNIAVTYHGGARTTHCVFDEKSGVVCVHTRHVKHAKMSVSHDTRSKANKEKKRQAI